MLSMTPTGDSPRSHRVERAGVQGVQARDQCEVSSRGDTVADQSDDIAASGGRCFAREKLIIRII